MKEIIEKRSSVNLATPKRNFAQMQCIRFHVSIVMVVTWRGPNATMVKTKNHSTQK